MRLIDADALPVKFWFGRFFGVAEIDIVNAPTIDAVEVVRCRDCKYWRDDDCKNDNHGYCPTSENDFCPWGERREDATKHGHWIKDRLVSTSGGTYGVCRCSVCEWYGQDIGHSFNYCPHCGAKMDDGERGKNGVL